MVPITKGSDSSVLFCGAKFLFVRDFLLPKKNKQNYIHTDEENFSDIIFVWLCATFDHVQMFFAKINKIF